MSTIKSLLNKSDLQDNLRNIMDQIKQTYYQFLSSLKFQNYSDKQSFKNFVTTHHPTRIQSNVNYPQVIIDQNGVFEQRINQPMEQQVDQYADQKVQQLKLKQFSFQEQLAVESKGYLAFIRLINNLKQLQDYNHYLRALVILNQNNEENLHSQDLQLIQDLKKLQIEVPNVYFHKKDIRENKP